MPNDKTVTTIDIISEALSELYNCTDNDDHAHGIRLAHKRIMEIAGRPDPLGLALCRMEHHDG
jgi:hypothetical protein